MIAGTDKPDTGSLLVGETVAPMYVNQSRDSLSDEKTVFEDIADGADVIDLNGREVNARQYCSWYNFNGADQGKKVRNLSARLCGEAACCCRRGRLRLWARLLATAPPDTISMRRQQRARHLVRLWVRTGQQQELLSSPVCRASRRTL